MVIDIHTHIFPDKIAAEVIENLSKQSRAKYFSDGTLNGLLNSMKNCGVNLSVVLPVATAPRHQPIQNSHVAGINPPLLHHPIPIPELLCQVQFVGGQ